MQQPTPAAGGWSVEDDAPVGPRGPRWRVRHEGLGQGGVLSLWQPATGAELSDLEWVVQAARLDGPELVRVLDLGRPGPLDAPDSRLLYVVQEATVGPYEAGPPPSSSDEALARVVRVLRALARCHHHGLVLGDLGATHLQLSQDGEVLLDPLAGSRPLADASRAEDLRAFGALLPMLTGAQVLPKKVRAWGKTLRLGEFRSALDATVALRECGGVPRAPFSVAPGRSLLVLRGTAPPPLVGREHEFDLLMGALASVERSRRAAAVLLEGETGCGLDRVVDQFLEISVVEGRVWPWVSDHQQPAGVAHGMGPGLLRLLGVDPEEGRGSRAELVDLLDPLPSVGRSLLADLLLGGAGSDLGSQADLVDALAALIEARSKGRVGLLVLREVQWASGPLELVNALLDRHPELPLLVLACARSELLVGEAAVRTRLDVLVSGPRDGRVRVGSLGRRSMHAFTRSGLGLSTEAGRRVGELARGRTLVAIEAARALYARGSLALLDGTWEVAGSTSGPLAEPQGAVGERFELIFMRRTEGEIRCIEAAAALGQEVQRSTWEAVCAELGEATPEGLLVELQVQGLAEPRHDGAPGDWRWSHPVVVDLLRRRARRYRRAEDLHASAARVLAENGPMDPRRLRAVVGQLLMAGQRLRALPLVEGAVAKAVAAGDAKGAARVVRLAEAISEGSRRPLPPRARAELDLDIAGMLTLQGAVREAAALATRVESEARRVGWPELEAQSLLLRARLAWWDGDPPLADDLLYRAELLADRLSDVALATTCVLEVAEMALAAGRHGDAETHLSDGVAVAVRRGLGLHEGRARRLLASCVAARGNTRGASEILAQAMVPLTQAGGKLELGRALLLQADIWRWEGNPKLAAQGYVQARTWFDGIGSAEVVLVDLRQALLAAEEGDLVSARRQATTVRGELERLHWVPPQALEAVLLVETSLARGERMEVETHLARAEDAIHRLQVSDRDLVATVQRALVHVGALGSSRLQRRLEALAESLARHNEGKATAGPRPVADSK